MLKRPRPAKKIFIADDLIERKFLCFLDDIDGTLYCIRCDGILSGENATLTFGSSNNIQGIIDAIPCPTLGMVLILDTSQSLHLYSGTSKVEKLISFHELHNYKKYSDARFAGYTSTTVHRYSWRILLKRLLPCKYKTPAFLVEVMS